MNEENHIFYEENHDGGWYPYRLVTEKDYRQTLILPCYLKDEQGLDIQCASREKALAILKEQESKRDE